MGRRSRSARQPEPGSRPPESRRPIAKNITRRRAMYRPRTPAATAWSAAQNARPAQPRADPRPRKRLLDVSTRRKSTTVEERRFSARPRKENHSGSPRVAFVAARGRRGASQARIIAATPDAAVKRPLFHDRRTIFLSRERRNNSPACWHSTNLSHCANSQSPSEF